MPPDKIPTYVKTKISKLIWRSLMFPLLLNLGGLPTAYAERYTYDVSGPHGQKDQDGNPSYRPGDTRGRYGAHGHDGGDAREIFEHGRSAKRGWNAGQLTLNLSASGDQIKVRGHQRPPEAMLRARISDTLPLKSSTSLYVLARGGRGGDGGRGGRGQDGSSGSPGADATRYSSGDDGGDGGRGGNEGYSTDGGDAGHGGQITLRVPIQDNDLAMLVDEVDVAGNRGGRRGEGFGAGHGGAGGPGGSSHTWIETRTESYTDAEGEHKTRLVFDTHHNPGGWSGSRGRDGSTRSHLTNHGKDSAPGAFRFEVEDENGRVKDYAGWYRLQLLPTYQIVGSHNTNGFFEPGETLTLKNVSVINTGHSPTPKYQRVKVFVSNSARWVVSEDVELTLPVVLEPGERYIFSNEVIQFHLAERKRDQPGLLRETELIGPKARVTRVEREFVGFSAGAEQKIKVQYPIEITPLETLVTLTPGEASRAFFKIKNISAQTIGQFPANEKLRFAHSVFRREGGSTRTQAFVVAGPDGERVEPKEGIERSIENLGPGEEILVETFIGLRDQAIPYTKVQVQPELYLQSLLEKNVVNKIQYEPFTLRVATKFQHQPDADVLLIANHELDYRALDALRATTVAQGLKVDIWDFSYYGFFNFSHEIEDYGAIFNAYRGKTVMILGNPVITTEGKQRADALLSPERVIEAARRYGIKLVILDNSSHPSRTVGRLTEPLPAAADPEMEAREHVSARRYAKHLRESFYDPQRAEGDEFDFLGVERVRVEQTAWWPWMKPKEATLRKRALKTLKRTDAYRPETKIFADYVFKPELTEEKTFGIFPRWNLGDIELRRTVDRSRTTVVSIDAPSLEDPRFILSEKFQAAFDLSLNFHTKLKMLGSVLSGEYKEEIDPKLLPEAHRDLRGLKRMEFAALLVHSLKLDLLHEQLVVRPGLRATKVSKAALWQKLESLRELTHYPYAQFELSPDSEEGKLFVQLIADLQFFSDRSPTWAQKYFSLGLSKNLQVSQVTQAMVDRLVTAVFKDVEGAREKIAVRTRVLRGLAKDRRIKRDQLLAYLDEKDLYNTSVRDSALRVTPETRIRSKTRQEHLRGADREREALAMRVRTGIEKRNFEFKLKAETCAELLRAAPAPGEERELAASD